MMKIYDRTWMIGILMLCLIQSCVPPSNTVNYQKPIQDFNHELTQQIYNLQTTQNFDSLAYFINNPDPMARFCATRAFGSFITEKANPLIKDRLQDSILEIRTEAAYAAGQMRDSLLIPALLGAFQAKTENNVNTQLNKNILEAIGKVGSITELTFLTSSKPYPQEYDKLNEGKAHAIYQFALRGLTTPKGTAEMVKFIGEDYSTEAKLMAANYLMRARDIVLSDYKFQLLQALQKESDPNIRMALASAVGKTGERDIVSPFTEFLKQEKDYRVVVNGIRQFKNFPYTRMLDISLQFLQNDDERIAIAAANYFAANGLTADSRYYLDYVNKLKNKSVQHAFQAAILKLIGRTYARTRGRLAKDLTDEFKVEENPYAQAEIIQTLGANPYLFQIVHDLSFPDTMAVVVKSKGVEVLGSILTDFLPGESRTQQRYLAPIIVKFMEEAMQSKDVGMIAAAASSLAYTEKNLVAGKLNREIIVEAIGKLELPKDIEAINYLVEANNVHFPENQLEKRKSDNVRINLDGQYNKILNDFTASILTNKGEIQVELYMTHAPESTLNFIDLSQQGYYREKFFHRVVPNFVVQAGCPRGDGYGSEDYTIRSELSPMRYDDQGYIGMASAGKHTESTQWFITHSPTPHLNGNYTIFGKVKKGMDVVHNLRVGDIINEVNIVEIPAINIEN